MARRRRKSIASTSEETPKNDTAAETAVEGITDTQEDKVASRSELDNDTAAETAVEGITDMQEDKVASRSELDKTMGERELEHSAVIVATNSVNGSIEYDNDTTIDKTDLKDDIIVANDEKNGVKLNAAEAEVNEEIVAGGGVEEEEEDDDDEEEDDEEEEEDDLYLESNVDGDLAVNNDDDGDEYIDDDIDDDEEGDEDEDDEEEENDDNYEVGDDNKLENENEEKHNEEDVKVANDAGSQENTLTEEVTKGNTKKGVNIKGERLKKKVRPAGNMNDEKKIPGGVSGQENLKAEHEGRQGDSGVVIEEADGGKSKEKIGGGGGNSKQKGKKLRKESRMKTVNGGSKIVSSELEDKPKQLPKKKSSKKVKSMGMIFICSTKTRNDCFQYKVLGLPASKRETVEKIYKGMRLFLYDIDRKLLYGIYKAAGPGGYNIQPKAFNSQFPAQVRFTILEDCLPIAEEKFKRVIKDNYFTKKKFDTILTSQQVKDLCKLFAATKHSKHVASEKPGRGLRRKAHVSKRQDRSRDRDEGLRSAVNDKHRYREYSPYRERAVSPLHPDSRLPPLPRTAALPYAYDRVLAIDGYRRDPLVEHRDRRDGLIERRDPYRQDAVVEHRDRRDGLIERRDPYRQDAVVEHRDPYRQDALVERLGSYRRPVLDRDAYRPVSLLEHHDVYRQQALLDHGSSYVRDAVLQRHDLSSLDDEYRRLDPLISYRRVGSSGDDVTMLDRYRSYRDRAVYRDPVSTTTGLVPEEDGYTVVGRSTAALLPEYRSVRPRYRY